jgi:hypothetical protein
MGLPLLHTLSFLDLQDPILLVLLPVSI